MKKFRKIMAVLVAAVLMISSFTLTAFAIETKAYMQDQAGTIEIQNADKGETYSIYKIFSLASFRDDTGDLDANQHTEDAYFYVLPKTGSGSQWKNFFDSTADYDANDSVKKFNRAGSSYVNVDFTNPVTIDGNEYYVVTGTGAGFTEKVNASDANSLPKDFINTDTYYSQSAQAFARAALDFANANSITPNATTNAATVNNQVVTVTKDSSSNDLTLGYYLVSSTEGTLVALDTTNSTAKIYEKNAETSSTKTVQEDSLKDTGALGDGIDASGYRGNNDANIGQTVDYKSVVHVMKGAKDYIMYDVMSEGLTFDNTSNYANVKVYLVDPSKSATLESATLLKNTDSATATALNSALSTTAFTATSTYYDVLEGTDAKDGDDARTFAIRFNQTFLTELDKTITQENAKYDLVVLYKATLNESAVVGGTGNTNRNYVKYGASQRTEGATTTTYTWEFDILKYTGTTDKVLEGAIFEMYNADNGTSPLRFVKISDGNYLYDQLYQNAAITFPSANGQAYDFIPEAANQTATVPGASSAYDHTIVTRLKSNSSGVIHITGLDGGDYTVKEAVAPEGYIKLAKDYTVHITSPMSATSSADTNGYDTATYGETPAKATQGDVLYKYGDASYNTRGVVYTGHADNLLYTQLGVDNKTTVELPSTGGMGTTVLYIVGGMLVILAGAYLFFSRKRTA